MNIYVDWMSDMLKCVVKNANNNIMPFATCYAWHMGCDTELQSRNLLCLHALFHNVLSSVEPNKYRK